VAASDVEHRRLAERMAIEDQLFLRPDGPPARARLRTIDSCAISLDCELLGCTGEFYVLTAMKFPRRQVVRLVHPRQHGHQETSLARLRSLSLDEQFHHRLSRREERTRGWEAVHERPPVDRVLRRDAVDTRAFADAPAASCRAAARAAAPFCRPRSDRRSRGRRSARSPGDAFHRRRPHREERSGSRVALDLGRLAVHGHPVIAHAEAESRDGAFAKFDATATTMDGKAAEIKCDPGAGSLFPMGTTTVKCIAWGPGGASTTDFFDLSVADRTAPQLSLPRDMTQQAPSPKRPGVYGVSAKDAVDGETFVTASQPRFALRAGTDGGELLVERQAAQPGEGSSW